MSAAFRSTWFFATVLLVGQICLYAFLQLRPGTIAFIPYLVGPKVLLLTAGVTLSILLIQLVRNRSVKLLSDWRLWTSMSALIGVMLISLFAYRVYPSSHDDRPSGMCFRLPLDGEVVVMQGGTTLEVNYHAPFRLSVTLMIWHSGATVRLTVEKAM